MGVRAGARTSRDSDRRRTSSKLAVLVIHSCCSQLPTADGVWGTPAEPCASPGAAAGMTAGHSGACRFGYTSCFDADSLGATWAGVTALPWLGTLPSCAAALNAAAAVAPGGNLCELNMTDLGGGAGAVSKLGMACPRSCGWCIGLGDVRAIGRSAAFLALILLSPAAALVPRHLRCMLSRTNCQRAGGRRQMMVGEHLMKPLCQGRTAASCAHSNGPSDAGHAVRKGGAPASAAIPTACVQVQAVGL